VAHEVQQREQLWGENNQLYLRLSRLEESASEVNLLEGIEAQNQYRREATSPTDNLTSRELERTVQELRAQVEVLKSEKDDVLLRAEYESTIEYNKLRSELHSTQ